MEIIFSEEKLIADLERIDRILQDRNIPISYRPLGAISEFSKLYQIGLPVSKPNPAFDEEVNNRWYITEFITNWYNEKYGNRLKAYLGPGECVFLLRGNPWVYKYPLSVGKFKYTVSKKEAVDYSKTVSGVLHHNVLDFITDFPISLRNSLSNQELHMLFNVFGLGLSALHKLKYLKGNELSKSAQTDLKTTVTHIMADHPDYGLAKWSTLQAAEKLIKFSLSQSNKTFSKTHNLEKLIRQFQNHKLEELLIPEIEMIQCSPSARYGEEEVSLQDTVNAFHSTLKLINILELKTIT